MVDFIFALIFLICGILTGDTHFFISSGLFAIAIDIVNKKIDFRKDGN